MIAVFYHPGKRTTFVLAPQSRERGREASPRVGRKRARKSERTTTTHSRGNDSSQKKRENL